MRSSDGSLGETPPTNLLGVLRVLGAEPQPEDSTEGDLSSAPSPAHAALERPGQGAHSGSRALTRE